MTNQVDHIGRMGDITPAVPASPRRLPSSNDDAAWTAELVADLADVRPCTRAELVDTYGTDDPEWLAAHFALDIDVQAARRYAAEDRQVAA